MMDVRWCFLGVALAACGGASDEVDHEDETQLEIIDDAGLSAEEDENLEFASQEEKLRSVADAIANRRGRCTTEGVELLARQLAEQQACMFPGQFVEASHPNLSAEPNVHLFMTAESARRLERAAARGRIVVSSGFRTVVEQLALYKRRGCQRAARPGESNHQGGRAVDVTNYRHARGVLTASGFAWFGSSDRVHFTGPGQDHRGRAILAFQRLWNLNHPEDPVREDGRWGTTTERRLMRAPVDGFRHTSCN